MRWTAVTVLLVVVLAALALAERIPRQEAGAGPTQKGLVVHEWGVFRVHENVDLANADMRAEWEGLPKFFYGQIDGRLPPARPLEKIVKKPVIFFHAPQAMALDLRVDFLQGMPAVWWPSTEHQAREDDIFDKPAKPNKPIRVLEWKLHLKQPPKGSQVQDLKKVDARHWLTALRAVQADEVFALAGEGSHDKSHLGGEIPFNFEREKFVYYDGLLPHSQEMSLTIGADNILATSRVAYSLLDVTIVDRRSPDHVRIGRIPNLAGKARAQKVEFVEVGVKDWPSLGEQALSKQLKEAGLYEDEAKSLVDVWKHEFFETDGLTVFYRLPQEEYERLLPLTMKPKAETVMRVGLVYQAHCEPGLTEQIADWIKKLDNDDFQTREQAQAKLAKLGAAAFAHLRRARASDASPELQRRLDQLLDKYDATKTMRRPE